MRTKQPGVGVLAGVIVATLLTTLPLQGQQHDPYHSTLYFGTGLINIPVAWVSPNSADAWVNAAGKHLPFYGADANASFSTAINTNLAIDTHWMGLFSVGASAYSQNPEYGFFGQVTLPEGKVSTFLPSIAVGVRNLGKYNHEDRFMVGHDIVLGPDGKYRSISGAEYRNFKTNMTFYGVATKEFSFGALTSRMPNSSLSFSLGYGNGLFSDDGKLGAYYNKSGTLVKGMFLGGRFSAHPTLNTGLQFMLENDGWDWNTGLIYDWRGLSAGLYLTELEEGGREKGNNAGIYNYMKTNFTLGYSGNIIDISRGVILRTRITELTREMTRLHLEIAQRERRIAGLEVTLRKAQAGELADIAKRRQELESQVQSERDAIRKAQERLEQLEKGGNPPPSNPPATPPQTQNQSQSPLTASF
jgi:hypothetical protein